MSIKILPTPIVNAIAPFDPSTKHDISFIYIGEQHNRIRCVITDNSNSQIVFDETVVKGGSIYTIPGDILTPSKQYLIQIQVLYVDDNEAIEKQSDLSDIVLFYCFTTPIFSFNEIVNNLEYNSSDINLSLNYYQSENEPIKSFQFLQYDINDTLINSSNTFYSTDKMQYAFYKMNNDSYYSFRAIGETSHGIKLDTGLIRIHVNYKTIPPNNVFLQLENNYCNGYITVTVNIKDISYRVNNEDYSFNGGKLKLEEGNYVTYYDGFLAEDDFSVFIEAIKLPIGTFFSTKDNEITLDILNICESMYCKLSIKNTEYSQFIKINNAIFENEMVYVPGKTMIIVLKRNNELYYFDIEYR